jgi:crotonobetainyl-CoA:carnitine CoA-transferase CaiB-like acyl-CoA transferase
MMSLNGDADQDFLRVGPPLIDYGTGAQTAFAIASALYQRERSGQGQLIEVNMFDAALLMMSPHVANAVYAGKTDRRSGNVPPQRPGYAVYACSDGQLMIGAFTLEHHRKLFEFLELGERITLPPELTREWVQDNADRLRADIAACLASADSESWETSLNAADIPAARVRDLHDVLVHDLAQRSPGSQFERFPGQDITAPIAAFSYAANGPALDARCARHGEDTQRVLAGLGYDDDELAELERKAVIAR